MGIDITERKRFESEMSRLERLNLVGQMAAGIAHENQKSYYYCTQLCANA